MNKSETLADLAVRLRECADICGGVGALAQKSAIPRRTIDSYFAGSSEPKWSNLKAIGEAAAVSFEWLVAGASSSTDQKAPAAVTCSLLEVDDYALIPGYNVQVSAGNGSAINEEQVTRKLAFRRKWLRFRGLHEKNLAVV